MVRGRGVDVARRDQLRPVHTGGEALASSRSPIRFVRGETLQPTRAPPRPDPRESGDSASEVPRLPPSSTRLPTGA
eukprot:5187915-Pyramimonas_sp.AAC.1